MRPQREVSLILPCPVCKRTRMEVFFLMPGSDYGDPAELLEIDCAGGPSCECYESGLVDQGEYDAEMLQAAVNAESLCGSPITRTRRAVR